jgi:DNA-binding transcriptional ArsR family regulator
MHLEPELDHATQILKTIAHPLRLRILSLLCRSDESVSGIAARLRRKPGAISQALQILRREGLVAVTRRHRAASYRLEERALRELIPAIERTLARDPRARGSLRRAPLPPIPSAPA